MLSFRKQEFSGIVYGKKGQKPAPFCLSFSAEFFSGMGRIPQDLRRVLLVDDIFTTGATMESCTRTLLAAGVEEVYCFALAIRSER